MLEYAGKCEKRGPRNLVSRALRQHETLKKERKVGKRQSDLTEVWTGMKGMRKKLTPSYLARSILRMSARSSAEWPHVELEKRFRLPGVDLQLGKKCR